MRSAVNRATVSCDFNHNREASSRYRADNESHRAGYLRDLTSGFPGRLCFLRPFLKVFAVRIPSKAATSKPIHVLGSPVRVKALLSLLFLISLTAVAVAQYNETQPGALQPVDTTQLAAWLAGGVPSNRLARLVTERGLATLPTKNELRQMEAVGANKDLMRVLGSGNALSARIGAPVPAGLLKAAAEVRQQHFREAEAAMREVLAADPQNSALHCALGAIYRQQEK